MSVTTRCFDFTKSKRFCIKELNSRSWIIPVILFFSISDLFAFQTKVNVIMDGDTIEVLHDRSPLRIRLYGIDTPEHDQDFGTRAKQFTSEKVFGKMVEVVPMDEDRYERTVAKIYVDGKYLNLMIVEAGLGWWYQRYAPHDEDLAKAEREARSAKIGLWSHPNPIPPWEFRRHRVSSSHRPAQPQPVKVSEPQSKIVFHGNVKSKVFHQPGCKHYDCKNCTATFTDRDDAEKAGYRPCGLCSP